MKINEINPILKSNKFTWLITGVAGFIGSNLLEELLINNQKVFGFDNFITGSSNKLAFEASKKVSENISHYNPLYIYGGVGMGKTHLLNSIGLKLKDNNKVMFISAERFMYQGFWRAR